MPMFMDHHKGVEGLTAEAVADAHDKQRVAVALDHAIS